MKIRQGNNQDVPDIVALSLLAWEPVFVSFRQVLGPAIYDRIYPDWLRQQQETIETYCSARPNTFLYVVDVDGQPVGFVVYELNHAEKPAKCSCSPSIPTTRTTASAPRSTSLRWPACGKAACSSPSWAPAATPATPPARRCNKKAGYTPLPLVRYYQAL